MTWAWFFWTATSPYNPKWAHLPNTYGAPAPGGACGHHPPALPTPCLTAIKSRQILRLRLKLRRDTLRPMTRAVRLLAVACFALQAANQDPWLRITSANFELFTTAGERSGRDLIKHFEQVRSFFIQAFGARLALGKPARIIAFRSEKEYRPHRPNEFATAFYQPGAEHDFIVMQSGSGDHYDVAVHEFTHLLIHQSSQPVPVWLNDGMAELYSNLAPAGSKIVVGKLIAGRVQTLLRENWIDLRVLVAVDHTSPLYRERPQAGMFYAESWALVHMLNLDTAYRPQFRAMVEALKDGDTAAAFERAYGKPIERVQEDLRAYLTGNTINAAVFDIQLPKAGFAPDRAGRRPLRAARPGGTAGQLSRQAGAGARRLRTTGAGLSQALGSGRGLGAVQLAAAQE